MGIVLKRYGFSILLFIFLSLHCLPLLKHDLLRVVTFFNYSVFLCLIFLCSLTTVHRGHPLKYAYLILLIVTALILYFFGFSGSISGYILSASVPYFLFMRINTYEEILRILYTPIKWAAFVLIILGAIFLYDIRNRLLDFIWLGRVFTIASINYVSLLFFSFSLLFLILFEVKKKQVSRMPLWDTILGCLLIGSSIVYSAVYLTRSTFIASVFLFIIFFRSYKIFLAGIAVAAFMWFNGSIMQTLVEFMGTDNVSDLASEDVRVGPAKILISRAIAFDYDFSENMSPSSLLNLFFSLFPFTLIFVFSIIYTLFNIASFKGLQYQIYYFALFGIGLFITAYQMDFLSVFSLFFLIQVVNFEYDKALADQSGAVQV